VTTVEKGGSHENTSPKREATRGQGVRTQGRFGKTIVRLKKELEIGAKAGDLVPLAADFLPCDSITNK